jgi:hypothetical protein
MTPDPAPRAQSHPIRAVALVQLCIATLCTLMYALPSVYFLDEPITLAMIVLAWGFGGYLMTRYFQVASYATTARATLPIWLQSLAFNIGGFALVAITATLQPSSGLEPVLGATLLPAALGALLGIVGIAMSALESKP